MIQVEVRAAHAERAKNPLLAELREGLTRDPGHDFGSQC
jgi:hypothetical protein